MRVLVTGGAGFIGSHVVDVLLAAGHEVVVVDNLCTGEKLNVNKNAILYEHDLAGPQLESVFAQGRIDGVCHLAARACVSFSSSHPREDATANIIASINLFSMCRKYGVPKTIYCSTAAVYGDTDQLPVLESHPTHPASCYGLSKLTAERYLQLLAPDSIVFRCANVYGPRQNATGEAGVISIFIDRMVSEKNVVIHGDGNQTRDFVYVRDVANAFICALQSDVRAEVINISSGAETSINGLWHALSGVVSGKANCSHDAAREGDIRFSCLSNAKAQRLLSWAPSVALADGLAQTISYEVDRRAIADN